MKVLCIDQNWTHGGKLPSHGFPKEGEVVTVDDMVQDDILYYGLVEYPHDWWEAAAFIPISNIDETKMIREYKTEKV